jgi:hypothetical protein
MMTVMQSWAMVVAAILIAVIIWQGVKSKGRCWDIPAGNERKPDDRVPGLLDNALLVMMLRDAGWRGTFWDTHRVMGDRVKDE